jgi:glutamate/aspartate transport system substrate-binding protein
MGYLPRRCVPAASLLAAAVLLTTAAGAQTGGSEGLSPTLANIKRAHVVRLGYRESSPPFSFLDQANRPIGYSLELCEAIVDEIGVEVDDANLKRRDNSHVATALLCRPILGGMHHHYARI